MFYFTPDLALLSMLICKSQHLSLKLLTISIMTWRRREGGIGEESCFVVGDFEKGRYLLLKSLNGKTANVPPHSDNENTSKPRPENSGPETLIYYNVLSTFRIYITLISFP